MIRIVIIEDEDFAVNRFRMLLDELNIDVKVTAVIDNVEGAVRFLNSQTVDLIFMDINLSDGSAFKIFEQVEVRTPIIFTTAYHEYALRAFEQYSIDYLLKPISREALSRSFDKFFDLKGNSQSGESLDELKGLLKSFQESPQGQRFLINIGSKLIVVEYKEIAFFMSDSKMTFLYTLEGKRYPLDMSLRQLELALPSDDFFRVNRQYLINRESIEELQYLSPQKLQVSLKPKGEEFAYLSKDKLGLFKKWLIG
ncbi:LytR/AlgR family response regulator transcription factor [Aureibacter tunicatorum]|uniref:DNA-binding LytR/AlgR family response regulator n=1 Tax=Aureibacter tunicatorum TaxID=866807 RepID=A0AAE3XJS1_9BACT|nr:LytTR family DNA-binding domain-containing protein [Aureibacter tunicatorum]MDR6237293.1 DNA-binding LytR/AlgR family response regulator [Aureibacter tunicatorum]BDD06284.1 DNA-binding response regulator [Aureibacter tunicatorum]